MIGNLQLGRFPRVIGTIITAEFLRQWSTAQQRLPCDLVELRVDGFPNASDWIEIGSAIERTGTPVVATVRLAQEGGKWARPDIERWPLLEKAARHLSGVDVELSSELAVRVCDLCRTLDKTSIVSFHDFHTTPSFSELRNIMEREQQLGNIAKVATTANTPEDLQTLQSLLKEKWNAPICIIGMGALGRETRLKFPLEGSCLTYGYLDNPGAPGQYSAAELSAFFESRNSVRGKD
jgi:3-dehydroquinate dehydratase I